MTSRCSFVAKTPLAHWCPFLTCAQCITVLASTQVLVFGGCDFAPPSGFRAVREVRVFGVCLDCGGVSSTTWHQVLEQVELDVMSSSRFRQPLHDRAYLIKSVICVKLFFAAPVALSSPVLTRRVTAFFLKVLLGIRHRMRG